MTAPQHRSGDPAIQNPPPPTAPARRLAVIDLARGVALLAMALYHLTWDLGFLRLTPENAALSPLGRAAAHGIAASFLMLVGVSLVLAQGRKSGWWRSYLARLGRIALAAGAISLATSWLFPDSWIFFGILHCIALSSVLALPALKAPLPLVGLAAALVLAGPTLAARAGSPGFLDAPGLLFLGLGATVPTTNDYVPLFPWFGFVLAGIGLGRIGLPRLAASRAGAWAPRGGAGRLATAAGRHSLAVYLLHQPLLLGLLYGVAAVTGPHPRAGEGQFLREYRANCESYAMQPAICRIAARCSLVRLHDQGLWQRNLRGSLTLPDQATATGIYQECLKAALGEQGR
ncbi:hypothetical protein VQ03_06925 [Methylobacterium tarhaniae]|uniref:Heparan-alpha-glucosaminide N-acetyltransferase catalytic domain-containing protein n=1 Tax=Methylobacterium tarhaniae TaxID=1187852 RepID=A0A0J6TD51_9HYPH|nr:heparan-alpha-glucosaminide N-acetyltransferase [Methylobacterium tarhaniae]KMO43799.1 hypothetical protein VQ03_06925 [Methylobacterium tarhaniae]